MRRGDAPELVDVGARAASGTGCATTGCLILVCLFVPVVGHIILTLMILDDDLTTAEKVLWLVVIWVLIFFVGPFLYLLLGQRKNRLFGGSFRTVINYDDFYADFTLQQDRRNSLLQFARPSKRGNDN